MIQSLLTQQEYDECSKIYKTYNPTYRRKVQEIRMVKIGGKEFQVGPPPNWKMGSTGSAEEIKLANKRLYAVLIEKGIDPTTRW